MAITSTAPDVYSSVVDLTQYADATPSTWGLLPVITEKGPDNVLTRVTRSEFLTKFGEPNINYTNDAAFGMGPYVAESFLSESDTLFTIRVLPEDAAFAHLSIKMYGMDATGDGLSDWLDSTNAVAGSEDSTTPFKIVLYPYYYGVEGDPQNGGALNNYAKVQQSVRDLDEDNWYDVDPGFHDASSATTDDGTNTPDPTLVTFYGAGRGSYYNNFQVDLNPHPIAELRAAGIYILDIYKKQTFSQRFSANPSQTNSGSSYIDYELIESFQVSFDPDNKGTDGNSNFIEDVVNEFSSELRVITNRTLLAEIARRAALDTTSQDEVSIDFSEAFKTTTNNYNPYDAYDISGNPTTTFQDFIDAQGLDATSVDNSYLTSLITHGISLTGGSDGSLFKIKNLVSGSKVWMLDSTVATQLLSKAYLGDLRNTWLPIDEDDDNDDPVGYVNEVIDTENFPFDVVFDAGYPQSVKDSIVILVNQRRDCIALIDNGDSKTATSALKARNPVYAPSNSNGRNTSSYNSRYVALYEPYTKVFDAFSGRDLWMPPSYHLARIIAFSDKNNEIWYPLAGFQRAVINNIKDIRYNPSNADRDQFTRQQLNPIARFSNGYAVFGQRTTQRTPSALQDLNVVRLVLYCDRVLKKFCRAFIFELNLPETWNRISSEVDKFLRDVQNRRGLYGYSVTVGADDYDIRMRRCKVDVILRPVRAIEQIELTFFVSQ